MEQGIRLNFVKTSEFRGGGCLNPPNPPPRYATVSDPKHIVTNSVTMYEQHQVTAVTIGSYHDPSHAQNTHEKENTF
jgi:hypothetical protein